MDLWLRPSLKSLAKSNRHTDCKFTVEDEHGSRTYPCHKLIFCSASEVFDRMLYGGYEESATGDVVLKDVDRDTFEKFREYVYSYEKEKFVDYNTQTMIKLAQFGNKYLVNSIIADCVKTLKLRASDLDIVDLLQVFECAHNINEKEFITTISCIIQHKWEKSLTHPSVYELSPNVFHQYVILTQNLLSESVRFNMIEMFLKMHGICESKNNSNIAIEIAELNDPKDANQALSETQIGKQLADDKSEPQAAVSSTDQSPPSENNIELWEEYVQKLVGLIDFKLFPPKEFYEGPGKSSLLTLEQKYELLYKISKENCRNNAVDAEQAEARRYVCNYCRKLTTDIDRQFQSVSKRSSTRRTECTYDYNNYDYCC